MFARLFLFFRDYMPRMACGIRSNVVGMCSNEVRMHSCDAEKPSNGAEMRTCVCGLRGDACRSARRRFEVSVEILYGLRGDCNA